MAGVEKTARTGARFKDLALDAERVLTDGVAEYRINAVPEPGTAGQFLAPGVTFPRPRDTGSGWGVPAVPEGDELCAFARDP